MGCRSHRIRGVFATLLVLSAGSVLAREPLSDAQVRDTIVKESVAKYLATGHPSRDHLAGRRGVAQNPAQASMSFRRLSSATKSLL
jgi:hypothetical protein